MPTVIVNRRTWSEHDWEHGGHKWSPGGTPSGTTMMWWRTVRARIQSYLPAGVILEIAPGFGRWTEYLLDECQQLVGVDLTPRCVEVCRDRFAHANAQFWVNDGESLPMIPDASVDFAISLDSLVHVELPQIQRYLQELARTLKPGGVAFLHHSNLGAYANRTTGTIPGYVGARHWRAASMSARAFRDACRTAGLACTVQELINWVGRHGDTGPRRAATRIPLIDCFSTCVRPLHDSRHDLPTQVFVNRGFVTEWRETALLTRLYGASAAPEVEPSDDAAPEPKPTVIQHLLARVRSLGAGRMFEAFEPLVRSLKRQRCPDCGRPATASDRAWRCGSCRTVYTLA